MNGGKVLVDISSGIMSVTLNRPEKLNAIDNELAQLLLNAIDLASRSGDVRVVLLRGAGRAFCAGRDLGAAPTDKDLDLVQAVASAIVELPKPVVAAVHGWTIGAGFEWVMDADVLLAAETARFRLPEASLGVFVTGGLTALLPASVGVSRSKGLMLLGEEFSAEQAAAWGLIWRVVSETQLDNEASRIANQLAALDPHVVSQFKKVINEIGLASFSHAIEQEARAEKLLRSTRNQ